MLKTFRILFYLKKTVLKADNSCPLMVRITMDRQTVSCSLQKNITVEEWSKRSRPGNPIFDLIQNTGNYLNDICQCGGMITVDKLKSALKDLLKHEWAYSCIKRFNRQPLTRQEATNISKAELPSSRLRRIRDLFIFCYLMQMTFTQISRLSTIEFKKLKSPPLAKLLVYLYGGDPVRKTILPVSSLQKSNSYLKEIAGYSHINRPLTFRSHLPYYLK